MSKEVISRFYQAFKLLDAESMATCYHPNIQFHDPAFGHLNGEKVGQMWRMLCENQTGKGMIIYFDIIDENNALWEAQYVFSKTGRKVHNRIKASFKFQDGLIIEHHDHFNLHRWATMALGIQGRIIGWTPFFQKKLQAQTQHLLAKFISRQ